MFNTIQRMLKLFARAFSFKLILSNLSHQPTSTLSHFKAKRTYKYKHRLLHFLVYFKLFSTNSLSSFLFFFNDHPRPKVILPFRRILHNLSLSQSCFQEPSLLICTKWRISIHCQDHHWERTTALYSCHDVFTDRSIFKLSFPQMRLPRESDDQSQETNLTS